MRSTVLAELMARLSLCPMAYLR